MGDDASGPQCRNPKRSSGTRGPAATREAGWSDYYEASAGRAVRPLLVRGLDVLEIAPRRERPFALDLGCGDGTESIELLRRGWHVHAVDSEPAAIAALLRRTPGELGARLETSVAAFEELEVPRCDLVHAGFSLPFCSPEHFERLWSQIERALRPGGAFIGQLFGVHDDWADHPEMTFHSRGGVQRLLRRFAPLVLDEEDEDGASFDGPKHWHVFHIVATRNENP